MSPPSLRATFVVLVVSAVAAFATPSLTVKASTPNVNVDGLEKLKVTTIVTNTGDETLKLLNDPRGVLDSFPENSFHITDAAGSRPSFNGGKVKYSPTYAAGLDDPRVFTVLAPGASVNITHDLSSAYNFTRSGAGEYTVEPSSLFTYVDADGTPKNLRATVEGVPAFKLSGNLAVSRVHDKRAKFSSCSLPNQVSISNAIPRAQDYANNAYSYLQDLSGQPSRYTTWFGTPFTDYKEIVQNTFRLIKTTGFSSYTYYCTCTRDEWYAFVFASDFGDVYLCPGFWGAPNTGTDSRAGTLIHESSHFGVIGGTEDHAYGHDNVKLLASSNIVQAIYNADSYQYFAENTPFLY